MSEKFNLEIISPEKILLKDEIVSATIPSFEGEMTILSNHLPLITFLRPGVIKITNSENLEYFVEEDCMTHLIIKNMENLRFSLKLLVNATKCCSKYYTDCTCPF